jgi:hypothetical protein
MMLVWGNLEGLCGIGFEGWRGWGLRWLPRGGKVA